jgi:hypothetical protein
MLMVTASTSSILDQILDPLAECLTPEVARRIVAVSLDPEMQSQIDELASKANDGSLSEEERIRYSEFIEAMDLVAIIKAKARLILASQSR